MANDEHLQILKQSVEQWNQWRIQHPEIAPDLSDANLSDANLNGADLNGADLNTANLSYANLIGAGLSNAGLSDVRLSRADLSGTDLSHARLNSADLSHARLDSADFTGAMMGRTILADVDLCTVKGLETIRHKSPSSLGMDTIVRSGSCLPLIFLRGVGIPETIIEYLPSLLTTPLQYHSCFLSYSSQDERFVKRLHQDLQNKGVRCWFAPHDLRPGNYFRTGIDEAIQIQDKLLLVLSEHSLQSNWVRYEVNQALARENEQGCEVLFPIRLDDAILQSTSGWAALLRRTRHIADFTSLYEEAFSSLLRHLKAEISKPG